MPLERGSPLLLEINNLIRCSPRCKGASFPVCTMETRSCVWLPTGNEWIQQIEGGLGQEGVTRRGKGGKRERGEGERRGERERRRRGGDRRKGKEEGEDGGSPRAGSARGIPEWLPPSEALPESRRGGYFGWQRDWELEKQEIEW